MIGGGQSNAGCGRGRYSFLNNKKTKIKVEGGPGGTLSLFLCALWAACCHAHKPSHLALSPVSQDTILKHSESVSLTPTARERENRMDIGICAVYTAFPTDSSQRTAHLPHKPSSSLSLLIIPLAPLFLSVVFLDRLSVNCCLYPWSCGGSLIG